MTGSNIYFDFNDWSRPNIYLTIEDSQTDITITNNPKSNMKSWNLKLTYFKINNSNNPYSNITQQHVQKRFTSIYAPKKKENYNSFEVKTTKEEAYIETCCLDLHLDHFLQSGLLGYRQQSRSKGSHMVLAADSWYANRSSTKASRTAAAKLLLLWFILLLNSMLMLPEEMK